MALPSIFINSLFFCILITLSPSRAQITLIPNPFTYSVEYFNQAHLDSLIQLGSARISATGALQITPDSVKDINLRLNKSGRFMLKERFKLWEESSTSSQNNTNSSGIVASFESSFLVNFFVPPGEGEQSGEGFAFVIAPDLDIPSNSHGEWLGLTNATLNSSSSSKFVAIEFDTKMQDYDEDDNHVGLDINSVRSNKSISLSDFNIKLAPVNSDVKHMVWVEYNGTTKLLEVYMEKENMSKPIRPVLSEKINLKDYVNQYSYLGFSASTGTTAQLNCVLEWNLTMEILPEDKDTWWKIVVGVGFVVMALIIGGVVGTVYYMKKNRAVDDLNIFNALMRLPGTPREFKFKDLKKATNNFDEKMKLGQGGFGVVYKGLLAKENIQVAVKQFSRESIKGKADFLAELTIINRLRHKHLVRLVGWCHKNGMLLLVYEYMPNGSLDNHLFGGPNKFLSWGHRYNIVSGVASALHYIHNEYDPNSMVVHRDLKSSNILLDSDYNARLGDFGLARALENGKSSYAELEGFAGTFGYIAPESLQTGKTTRESDVFGFGAVVLEVVCGQRPWTKISGSMVMVDWVWNLYREGRILEAVDERIGSDFMGEEAERLLLLGLACSHPTASERPKAQKIIQIISGSAPVPYVPQSKPNFVWPVTYHDGESPEYLGLGGENHMGQISITTNS